MSQLLIINIKLLFQCAKFYLLNLLATLRPRLVYYLHPFTRCNALSLKSVYSRLDD